MTASRPDDSIALRTKTYFKLSSDIAQIDNDQLRALLDESEASAGWGKHQTVEIGRNKVFVKRVPITELEHDSAFSTRNLYGLPLYYNYGVGSAGLGVFRELVTHVKTTNWVLEGAIANFPLMYHYRIMPVSGSRPTLDMEVHKRYVAYWGDNENIGKYWSERVDAQRELVVFIEHIPHTLQPWLLDNPAQLQETIDELRGTIDFLRAHGIIHFDAHFYNVVTDGQRPFLTDFGLVLDRGFELTEEEARFFEQHTHYDYGEVLWSVGHLINAIYTALPDNQKRAVLQTLGVANEFVVPGGPFNLLVHNVERLSSDGTLAIPVEIVSAVVRYRSVITLMQDFFVALRSNMKKDTPFPHADLRQKLFETRFVA